MKTLINRLTSPLLGILLALSTLIVGAGPLSAQGPEPPTTQSPESLGAQFTEAFWHADYFANTSLADNPVLSRDESSVWYDWGAGSPAPGIVPNDNFSARWVRNVQFLGGTYRFSATVDDGVRVYLDRNLIIDKWMVQSARTFLTDVYVTPGHHTVTVEYFELGGLATMRFTFSRLGGPTPPPAGEVIVDELSGGFSWSGPLSGRHDSRAGWAGHSYYTKNLNTGYQNGGKWTPTLSRAGNYEVFAWVSAEIGNSRSVRYRVFHNGVRADAIVNQQASSNVWVSLGTHYFNASNNGSEFVFVADGTGEPNYTRYIGFDALKWVPR